MADEPIPSRSKPLPTNVTPALPDGVAAPSCTAIKTAPDGARGKPKIEADKEAPPLHIPWSSWLLNLVAQFAFGLLLAVFPFVVRCVSGFNPSNSGWTSLSVY